MIGRALAVVLVLAGAASADELAPAARDHLNKGLRHFDVQRYGDAIEEFRAGYEIDPKPAFLYALGQAHRFNGDCKSAVEAYRAFLRTSPPPRQDASAKQNLQRCINQIESAPKPEEPAATPPSAVPPPPAPAPIIIEREVVRPAPPSRWQRDPLGGALLGIGLASAGASVGLFAVAETQAESVKNATTYDQFNQRLATASAVDGERIGAGIAIGVGGALVIGAIVRYVVVARRSRR